MTTPTAFHAPTAHLFDTRTLCGVTGPRHAVDVQVTCVVCRGMLLGMAS